MMNKIWRILFVLAFFIGIKFGISRVPYIMHSGAECSTVYNPSSLNQQPNAGFPSHGFAMLILRFNETSKEKQFCNVQEEHVLKTINDVLPDISCKEYNGCCLLFLSKSVNYEAFLYSLPLRSPPLCC